MTLMTKILDGRTDLIFDYLANGGQIQDQETSGASLMKTAAYYGDVSALKYLQLNGASLDELGDNYDLNGAAFHGHWQLCQYLLEQGADARSRLHRSGETPLHSAISKANNPNTVFVVRLLLAHGADPNAQTVAGAETGGFMRDARTYGESPLHRAAAFGDEHVIQALLDAGATKELVDINGHSPLSWASWHLRPGKILSLLAFGDHRIHPLHIQRMRSDHGFGPGGGSMNGLLGSLHI